MSAELVAVIDRLSGVVTNLEVGIKAEVAALAAAVAAQGTPDPDVGASVGRLSVIADQLTADAATLIPPAPPAPAPAA